MKKIIGLISVIFLAGCSSASSLLDTKANVPQASAVQVGNNLALPPDLQLVAPTATRDRYQPNGYVAPIVMPAQRVAGQATAFADPSAGRSQAGYGSAPQQAALTYSPTETVYTNQGIGLANAGDYYAKYGISRFKKNGKLKTKEELQKELTAVVLAKKRATNPNYGTVANIGNLGSGGDKFIMKP